MAEVSAANTDLYKLNSPLKTSGYIKMLTQDNQFREESGQPKAPGNYNMV